MYDTKWCKKSLDKLLSGSTQQVWVNTLSKELGCIVQGIGTIKENDVIYYIKNQKFQQEELAHIQA